MNLTLDISSLTPTERLALIGELWDSLSPEDVNLTPAHDAELARRMVTFVADTKTARSWKEIEAELNKRT